MTFPEYIEQVKADREGDPHFRLLKGRLENGHKIMSVRLHGEHDQWNYEFVLSRLGTSTSVEVPVGGTAVELFLFSEGLKLGSRDEEVQRCVQALSRSMEPLRLTLGASVLDAALRLVAAKLGGPKSGATKPAAGANAMVRAVEAAFRRTIDGYVGSLVMELGYPISDAATIMDEALAAMQFQAAA